MDYILKFEGDNWWGDHTDLDNKILEIVKEGLKSMSISSVTLRGTDLQDGRIPKYINIDIDGMAGEMRITKYL